MVRPLYVVVMGDEFDRVARPIRAFHVAEVPARFAGRARVERGGNPLAQAVAWIIGLPVASDDCAVEVLVTRDARGVETWRRTFAGRSFSSKQEIGKRRWAGLVVERFGPMAFAMAAFEREGELHLDLRGWSAHGVPMPRWLGPRAVAFEHAADGRFNFDVAMRLPLIGLVVRYRGWLEPAALESP